jgi:hypothetical protein
MFVFALLFGAVSVHGSELVVDLGTLKPTTLSIPRPADSTVTVKVMNLLPKGVYTVKIDVVPFSIPVLDLSSLQMPLIASTCVTDAKNLTAAINQATDEKGVAAARKPFEKSACKEVQDVLATLDWTSQAIDVDESDSVHVVVTRKVDKGDDLVWDVTFTGRSPGEFQAAYGFAFIPSGDRTYTAVKDGDQFKITRDHDRSTADYVPVVFFQWIPRKSHEQNVWPPQPTAGIGFDRDNISVFAGATAVFHRNVGIALGVAMTKQQRLNGQYNEGDTVKDALTSTQLQKTTYAPSVFVALTFRFGSQPFSAEKLVVARAPSALARCHLATTVIPAR